MIAFFALVVGIALGIIIGTGLVRPYLDAPRAPVPQPRPVVSLASTLYATTTRPRMEIVRTHRKESRP